MRAVGYCRFSSENQSDGFSIEAQKKAIEEFATKEGYELLRFYVDEAKTDEWSALLTFIETFHGCKFHRLGTCHLYGTSIAREHSHNYTCKTYGTTDFDRSYGKVYLTIL